MPPKNDPHLAPSPVVARTAGLRYMRGTPEGIERVGSAKKFKYLQAGKARRD